MSEPTFELDGEAVSFRPGDTVLAAATRAGRYIPHLCWSPEFHPHGSCRLCIVKADGHFGASCTLQAAPGQHARARS